MKTIKGFVLSLLLAFTLAGAGGGCFRSKSRENDGSGQNINRLLKNEAFNVAAHNGRVEYRSFVDYSWHESNSFPTGRVCDYTYDRLFLQRAVYLNDGSLVDAATRQWDKPVPPPTSRHENTNCNTVLEQEVPQETGKWNTITNWQGEVNSDWPVVIAQLSSIWKR